MYINSNNSRKIHGLPLRRKHNKRKRFFTRCEAMEAVEDFLNWCDGYKFTKIRRMKNEIRFSGPADKYNA